MHHHHLIPSGGHDNPSQTSTPRLNIFLHGCLISITIITTHLLNRRLFFIHHRHHPPITLQHPSASSQESQAANFPLHITPIIYHKSSIIIFISQCHGNHAISNASPLLHNSPSRLLLPHRVVLCSTFFFSCILFCLVSNMNYLGEFGNFNE